MIQTSKMGQILFTGLTVNDLLEQIGQVIEAKISSLPTLSKEKQSDYLTRKEVCALLKITLPTLHEWTKLGYLNSYKIGSRRLYKAIELESAFDALKAAKHKKGGFSHA